MVPTYNSADIRYINYNLFEFISSLFQYTYIIIFGYSYLGFNVLSLNTLRYLRSYKLICDLKYISTPGLNFKVNLNCLNFSIIKIFPVQ